MTPWLSKHDSLIHNNPNAVYKKVLHIPRSMINEFDRNLNLLHGISKHDSLINSNPNAVYKQVLHIPRNMIHALLVGLATDR